MIDTLLWLAILTYVLIAFFVVKRMQQKGARILVTFLLALPVSSLIYKHVIFRIDCQKMVEEQVLDRRINVDGVLVSYNWGMDVEWVYWLVDKGGYKFAEYKSGEKEFERNFWNAEYKVTQRMSSPDPLALYEIKIIKSMPNNFIIKNEFVAVDRKTNKILGRKVLLFMQAGGISRYLNWILTNSPDNGGLTCPSIRSTNDILGFFPSKVLVPSPHTAQ